MYQIKVAFDADGTLLAKPSIQAYAKELIDKGYDVHIVTRRYDSIDRYTEDFKIQYKINNIEAEHKYLFEVADSAGIPRENIHFMNMTDKWLYFKANPGFLWHLDDDWLEINDINRNTKTSAISCLKSSWENKCRRLIEVWEFNNIK